MAESGQEEKRIMKNKTSKTLHLNLKRKWFDMVKLGDKPEE
jgi:hypothetical protein